MDHGPWFHDILTDRWHSFGHCVLALSLSKGSAMGFLANFRLAACTSLASQLVKKALEAEGGNAGRLSEVSDRLVLQLLESTGIARSGGVPNAMLLAGGALAYSVKRCDALNAVDMGSAVHRALTLMSLSPGFNKALGKAVETGGVNSELADLIFSVFEESPGPDDSAKALRAIQEESFKIEDEPFPDLLAVRPGPEMDRH